MVPTLVLLDLRYPQMIREMRKAMRKNRDLQVGSCSNSGSKTAAAAAAAAAVTAIAQWLEFDSGSEKLVFDLFEGR
ncbi:hypothetical protein SK128_005541 [Halocaridina rubra]|uniref:Uncharacterized protein n=1 Tax=Halocaridina rubra TaxID=373956 RepID=A0AAN8X3Q7_HALRR